jgi:TRAP-type C4-dicarboxylate transport system substrate-binding protein
MHEINVPERNKNYSREKKMKKWIICFGVMFGLFLVINSFSTISFAAEAFKPKTLKFAAGGFTESSFHGKHYKWWAEEVEKRTGGRVKVQMFWMESLAKAKDMLPAIQSGYTDVGWFVTSYFPSYFPLYMLLDHGDNFMKTYGAALSAAIESLDKEPNLKAEMEKQKVIVVAPYASGRILFMTKKCINSITELKGKSVRSVGGIRSQYFSNLGANPVFMTLPDSYEALDRGTISVIGDISASVIVTYKYYEVAKCIYVDNPFVGMLGAVFMNLDVFNSFPKDIQEILIKLRTDYTERFSKELTEFEKEAFRDLETKHGQKFAYPSPEEQKVMIEAGKKATDDAIKKLESQGNTAARKVIDYFQGALKRQETQRGK